MAEEHGYQAPEGHRPCVNNCGFFGSPATMNLCSKCYRDSCQKEQQQASIKSSFSYLALSSSTPIEVVSPPPALTLPEVTVDAPILVPEISAAVANQPRQQPNRCLVCRKRVGLTGFKCRCGTHRYPEQHGYNFDFKKLGREEIVIGVSIMVVSLAGFAGACYRNTFLMSLYLFAMFFIILALLGFIIFSDSSSLKDRVADPNYWAKISSCLRDSELVLRWGGALMECRKQ